MEEKSAGIQRSRRVRYDGGWETVYWLDPQGALGLPRPVLETYGLCPGDSLAVGRICPQSVELVPGRPGEAAISPSGLLRLPLGVWRQTDMVPRASWLALFPFRRTLFLVDRGLV